MRYVSPSTKQLVAALTICLLAAPAFAGQRKKRAHVEPRPTSISFDPPIANVAPKQKLKIKAIVRDQNGRTMPAEKVSWQGVSEVTDSPLSFSRPLDDSEGNTLIVIGGAGNPAIKEKITTLVTAIAGDASSDLVVTYESIPKPLPAKITFEPAKVELTPDGEAKITATLKDSEDKPMHGTDVSWSLAKPELNEFVRLGTVVNDDKTNSVTLLGRRSQKKPPDVITLIATAGNATSVFAIDYKAPRVRVESDFIVMSPKVCGDLFGRTIRNNFYCIEVAIDNKSDSDIALGGLKFSTPKSGDILTSYYPVVEGSLARRKITHPRAIVMAAIDSLGTLMTGFNPFFHNVNHAKNYSQFIDILSNPVAKGVAAVWQDPYPIEMANFTGMILKDDKIIKKDDKTFKTVVFVEKRNVYPKGTKTGDDPIEVKKTLGRLVVMGQDIQQGPSRDLTQ